MRRSESWRWLPASLPRPTRNGDSAMVTRRRKPSDAITSRTASPRAKLAATRLLRDASGIASLAAPVLNQLEVHAGVGAQPAVSRFPGPQQKEGNDGRRGPQLRLPRRFGLRLPAEKLLAQDERNDRAHRQ